MSWHKLIKCHGKYSIFFIAYTQLMSWHILNWCYGIYLIDFLAYTPSFSWHIPKWCHGIYSIILMAYTQLMSWHIWGLKLFFKMMTNDDMTTSSSSVLFPGDSVDMKVGTGPMSCRGAKSESVLLPVQWSHGIFLYQVSELFPLLPGSSNKVFLDMQCGRDWVLIF